MPTDSALTHPPQTLFSGQTETTATGVMLLHGRSARVTVAVIGVGTLSTGVVTIEEAYYTGDDPASAYTGTWSPITTVTASTLTGGAQTIVHITGSVWALRARISTTVTGSGGSVSCVAWSN